MLNLQSLISNLQPEPALSFLHSPLDVAAWRTEARAKAIELLRHSPARVPLNPEIVDVQTAGDIVREKVYFDAAHNTRIPAYLLRNTAFTTPQPGIVALHDHGGYYIHGKEKLVQMEDEPKHLQAFKKGGYGGVNIANALAQRGYVVLVIDAFYFGERRMDLSTMTSGVVQQSGRPSGTSEIAKENGTRALYEELTARHIFAAGSTWMGMMSHDDRVSVDYLASRPEVDAQRMGCIGLSLGCMRTHWLRATDPRIRAAVAAGWTCDWRHLHEKYLAWHSWAQFVPGMAHALELSDLTSISSGALFVQQCSRDELFPLNGMQATVARLEAIHQKAGAAHQLTHKFYDCGHELNPTMQADAFAWLDTHLR